MDWRRPNASTYWNISCPGRSWQRCTMCARRRSVTAMECSTPPLPRNVKRGVARRRLDVAVGVGTDPDVGPARRNRERVEPLADFRIVDEGAARQVIAPATAHPAPGNAGHAVGHIQEAGVLGGLAMLVVVR